MPLFMQETIVIINQLLWSLLLSQARKLTSYSNKNISKEHD